MGSTRLEDLWCLAARRVREETEGSLDLSAIRESHRVTARRAGGSTLHEDAHDPLLVRMRAETGDVEAQALMQHNKPF